MTITNEETALYPKVVNYELEPHYSRHVSAMTSEGLHAKSDIAEQLAWRDQRIEALAAELAAANKREAELTASGKVLVESNTRFFREARDNWERAEAAESRLAELHGALEWCLREVKYVAFDQVALSFWCSDLELQRGNCFTSTRLAGSDGPSIAAALIASKGEGR